MAQHLMALVIGAATTGVLGGWIANAISTAQLAKRIDKASSLALWIHGIHGIFGALDPLGDGKERKE